MSGYDIKKQVKSALGSITSASYGTLYPTLHKLLAEGCVEMEEVPQRNRPSKKVYSVTEKGREELRQWLREPAAADQVRREFLLKLYLAKSLGNTELLSLIANRRAETEILLQVLETDSRAAVDLHQQWVLDYARCLYEAEIKWLEQFEDQIGAA